MLRVRWHGLIFALVVGAVISCQSPAAASVTTPTPQPAAASADNRAIGPANAPVTIIEFGDFGCTTCRAWHNSGTLKQLLQTYGNKVHFVWRDLPVITPDSPKAAEAGQCAADQGKFWEFHDLVYATFKIDIASLKGYAQQLGLDQARFDQCLDSGQHKADVDRDWQEGKSHGFQATPAFLINDKPFAGPPTFAQLQSLIDPFLKTSN